MNRRISIIVMNRDAEDRLLKLLPSQGEERRRRRPGEGRPTSRRASAETGMRILVVDDFLTMRRVVRGFLREMGFDDADVVEAAHGTAALDGCARRRSTSSSPTSRCRSSAASGCCRRSRRTPRCATSRS
jgi:PleD family two-component response regulator